MAVFVRPGKPDHLGYCRFADALTFRQRERLRDALHAAGFRAIVGGRMLTEYYDTSNFVWLQDGADRRRARRIARRVLEVAR